ncbi:hypothetical protein B4082_3169 [Bacillus cereus]|uniref:Uncharacterized protein n=1 Tax=Bacillus cereus TaxID=1396 RepID=A0A164ESV7_BACCE|nr:hypothetical protein B4082_3169 [Bacillus cereus]
MKNEAMLRGIEKKAGTFFGKKNFKASLMQSITMLTIQ